MAHSRHFLSILAPSVRAVLFSVLLLASARGHAQLVVYTATVQDLVQNVLLGGGVTVSNITFNGLPAGASNIQIGSFDGTACNVGLGQGLLLCTGDITVALGPNDNPGYTWPDVGVGSMGDPDLDQLLVGGVTTHDAAVLEFDFVPQGDEISFNYVFGSEEYLEFVNLGFNDVFGFFLSGPGIVGPYSNNAINIALVPGTATPVAIDNVNSTLNAAYYVDNGDGFTLPQSADAQYIQFDGFTVPLTASAQVQCGQTYHLKIAVQDVGDGLLDSGVFLEAGSLNSPNVFTAEVVTESTNGQLVEGCAGATLVLARTDMQAPLDIQVALSGSTTNGVDHTMVPAQFTIPAGQPSITFDLAAFDDQVTEGTEQLVLTLTYMNACALPATLTLTIPVIDNPVTAQVSTTATTCPGACNGTATVVPNGGVGPFTFAWSGALAGNSATTATAVCAGTYSILVTDALGCAATDTFTVADGAPLTVEAGPDTISCGGAMPLQATVTGANTALTWAWTPAAGLSNPASPTPVATVNDTVQYIVAVHPAGLPGCTVSDSVTIIFDPGLDPGTDSSIVICPTVAPFALADMLGGDPAPGGSWTVGGQSVPAVFDPATGAGGTFTYQVTSAAGCSHTAVLGIQVLEVANPVCCGTVDAGPDVPVCGLGHGLNAVLGLIGSGTWTGPPGYVITPAQGAQAGVIAPGPGAATFHWTENDGTCLVTDSVTITFTDTIVPTITPSDALCHGACDGGALAALTGGTAPYTWQWTAGTSVLSTTASVADLCAGTVLLSVTDANGCTAQAEAAIGQPAPLVINDVTFTEPWCHGACDGTITINHPLAASFSFNGGAIFGASGTATGICAGLHDLVIRDAQGCQGSTSVLVTEPPPVIADFVFTPEAGTVEAPAILFTNTSVNGTSIAWDIAGLDTTAEAQFTYTFDHRQSAEYLVCLVATDAHGCVDTTCRTVVINDVLETYVPNCFTPDADGVNDRWGMLSNIPDMDEFELSVFDRWGQVVFRTTDPLGRWDGSRNNGGDPLKQDVYVYHISFRTISTGLPMQHSGHVTLLK